MLGDSWMVNVDLNGISDNNYIVDLGLDFYNCLDIIINWILGVEYFFNYVDFSFYVCDFDIIGDYEDIYWVLFEVKI